MDYPQYHFLHPIKMSRKYFGFETEIDEVFTKFVRGDWSDYPDTDYGEEGHNYYEIHTKNYIHLFSKMMPFGEHFTLCRSDKKK